MKKIILLLVLSLFSIPSMFAQNMTFDDGTVWNCDQNYTPVALRYWKLYSFYDTWNNLSDRNVYLNTYNVQYKNASYLSQGQAFTNGSAFDWTQTFKNASFTVAPFSSMRVLTTRYEDWGIVQHPVARSNPALGQYDFMIAYRMTYDFSNNYPDASDDGSHVECQPYYVTWCGDGIKDVAYEQCDGSDGISAGQTCNSSCQIENNPVPACINLTSSILIGTVPVSTNVSCTTENATNVSIDCGNGITINGSNGVCTYTTPGYYSAICRVNGTITNANCQKNIQVDGVTPVCEPSRTGTQTSPLTQGYCSVGTPSNFVTTGTNPINYSWTCNNASQSTNCNANYTPGLNACIPGTTTGPQANPVTQTTAGLCPTGQTVGGFAANTVGNTTNYSWSCNGSAVGGACSASYTPPANACIPGTTTGPQANPVTASTSGLCPTGQTVGGFTSTAVGATTNYSWSCNGSAVGGACSASYTPGVVNTDFDLRIKKYAKSEDIFASVNNTEDFNYNIVVENRGTGSTSGLTTVIDVLPSPVVLRGTPSGNGWSCTGNAGGASFTCTTAAIVTEGQVYPVITVPVRITNLVYRTGGYTNTAFVQNPNEATGRRCFADNHMPIGNETQCTQDTFNADPATINPPNPNGYDLRLKKFVNGDDESTRGIPGNSVAYTFILQNLGLQSSAGTITVTDNDFAGGITIASIAATQGEWSCTQNSGTSFSCTTNQIYASGAYSSPITVIANIPSNIPVGQYRNVACLSNAGDPDESAVYNPDIGQYKNNNCDPALVVITPLGSFDFMLKKYVADTTTGTPINDGDHQTATVGSDLNRDVLTIGQGGTLRYRLTVTNLGYVTATGTTTIEDTFPDDLSLVDVAGTGWTCTTTGTRSFTCARSDTLVVGAAFPDIVINVRTAGAIPAGFYSNVATLRNPFDTNSTNNIDPANVRIVVGATCGAITANQGTTSVAPNTAITYTCAAAGFPGNTANLQYNIACAPGDTTATWSGSATRVCTAPNGYSSSQTVSCGVRENTNPSVVFTGSFAGSCSIGVSTYGGGGGAAYVGKKCVNNIATCAVYNTLAACTADNISAALCYTADSYGYDACKLQSLSCGGGGGGGGYCGNGVLETGEQCDIAGGASWCTNCKINMDTTPGANPLETWITIPALTHARLGWAQGNTNVEMPFIDNRVVVGQGTKVFTLADIVGFGMKRGFAVPLFIEYEKPICLNATGNGLNAQKVCTTFGEAISQIAQPNVVTWTHPMTKIQYVILGRGDFQYQETLGGPYKVLNAESVNNINLFKGSTIYGGLTLHDSFIGQSIGTEGHINLGTVNNGEYYDFVWFPVRVSAAIVGTTGTPVNRSIQSFVNQEGLRDFLKSILTNSTTTSSTTTSTSASSIAPVTVNVSTSGDKVVNTITDLEAFAVNGNKNILAVKNGNLTINCPAGSTTFQMTGVRTIIVENGNLIFNCNTTYASNDATSSFAWIVKGGNIQVFNGNGPLSDGAVTNIAGVYVAIAENGNGGKITYAGANNTTQKILKIEGSLYGDATGLFKSRLYARGTSAYDILTTGTIVTYSNRALVNPPPLLSQYLNNYSVQRVIK